MSCEVCAFKADGAASALLVKLEYGYSIAPQVVYISRWRLCTLERNPFIGCLHAGELLHHVGRLHYHWHTTSNTPYLHVILHHNIAVCVQALRYADPAAGQLLPNVLSLIHMMHAEGGLGQGLKSWAGPVAAENAAVESDSNVSLSPLSLQGVAKGSEMQSSGKTADRMAQALRYCRPPS